MNGDFLAELSALMEKHGATLSLSVEDFWRGDYFKHEPRRCVTHAVLTVEVLGKVVGCSVDDTLTPIEVATMKPEANLTKL